MKLIIDGGHGPDTPGKRTLDDSMKEYEFNSNVADKVRKILELYDNVEIIFTHSDKMDVPLSSRTDKANELEVDAFISIHANAYGSTWNEVSGIETYVHTSKPEKAYQLAIEVQTQLIRETGRKNRGVKTANFHVLRETDMTAILIECGFMTNKDEAELLKSDSYRSKCATAIAQGIVNFYKLKLKSQSSPESESFFTVQVGKFRQRNNAESRLKKLQRDGYSESKSLTT